MERAEYDDGGKGHRPVASFQKQAKARDKRKSDEQAGQPTKRSNRQRETQIASRQTSLELCLHRTAPWGNDGGGQIFNETCVSLHRYFVVTTLLIQAWNEQMHRLAESDSPFGWVEIKFPRPRKTQPEFRCFGSRS